MALLLSGILNIFEKEIPLSLQEPWDTSGLQVGSRSAKISRVLFAYDACHEVIREAVAKKIQLIITHHPLIFKPLKNLDASSYDGWTIAQAIKHGIAIYSAHTSHDNSKYSLNRFYAEKLGLKNLTPLSPSIEKPYCKLVVFVPADHTEKVGQALFHAGAGHIGNYSSCSFKVAGTGTFKGDKSTHPFLGVPGEVKEAKENRLEVIVPRRILSFALEAMLKAHPYEEVAYDIVGLENPSLKTGSGIVGELEKRVKISDLLASIKKMFAIKKLKMTGFTNRRAKKIAICTGSGTSLLGAALSQNADLFITGDVKYHYAVLALRNDLCLVDVGHFHSEIRSVTLIKELFKKWFGSTLNISEYTKLKEPMETC